MARDSVNGPEPIEWSFVVARVPGQAGATVWEHDRDAWFCLCCDGRAQWDQLIDPVLTTCPDGYINGAWWCISGKTWPLAVR